MSGSSPPRFAAAIAQLPLPLRSLIEAELAAGNEIADVIHTFPAPPAGCCVRLARPLLTTTSLAALPDLLACRYPNWDGSSGVSDLAGHFFLLGPAMPPSESPSMEEIRTAGRPAWQERENASGTDHSPSHAAEASPFERFRRSLQIDYEQWHDGVGYDVEAIRAASSNERGMIESLLLERGVRDWRDVEALACLNTPQAWQALVAERHSRNHEVTMAILEHAPDLLSDEERTAMLVRALRQADFLSGLTPVLDQAEAHHPPAVIDALLRGTLAREGDIAVHFAALLMFLHGKADSSFDWAQRPFFLTFNTLDRDERAQAFKELCRKISRDPEPYLSQS